MKKRGHFNVHYVVKRSNRSIVLIHIVKGFMIAIDPLNVKLVAIVLLKNLS